MPNVLLVTIDSLRPDYLGCYSEWARAEGLSPHLDEWARSACLFETAITQGPRTPEAFPAILSGQYASRYRDVFSGLSPERKLISEILKGHGYACAAFNSNPYISRQMGYSRGFDLYEDNLMVVRRQGLAGRLEAGLREHLLAIDATEEDLRYVGIEEQDEEVKSRLKSLGYT